MRRLLFVLVLAGLSASPLFPQCTLSCAANVPPTAAPNTPVSFQAAGTPCNCTAAATYAWDFGDGGSSTERTPTHTYASAGNYNWQLTVTADGVNCTKSGTISISSSVVPTPGTYQGTTSQGRAISITVNSSGQITGWSVGYQCSFGSGTTTQSTNCAITNGAFTCGSTFCAPFVVTSSITGTFTSPTAISGSHTFRFMPSTTAPCCTLSGNSFTASLSPAPLAVTASANPTSGLVPLGVSFTATASGGNGSYTYEWDFGDCSPLNAEQNPMHTYQAARTFFAVVRATSGPSEATAAPLTITVQAPSTVTVSSVTPNIGNVNGGESVTIRGSGFEAGAAVLFDAAPATSVTVADDTTITAITPAHAAAQVSVTVTNTDTGSGTLATAYTYDANANLRGDANGNGSVDLPDVFYMINYVFAGGPAPVRFADANGDGLQDVSDIFYLINYIFAGGAPPAAF